MGQASETWPFGNMTSIWYPRSKCWKSGTSNEELFICFLFYVYRCFACKYTSVYCLYAWCPWTPEEGIMLPWDWAYKQLWATVWELGLEPRSFRREASATKASLQSWSTLASKEAGTATIKCVRESITFWVRSDFLGYRNSHCSPRAQGINAADSQHPLPSHLLKQLSAEKERGSPISWEIQQEQMQIKCLKTKTESQPQH